MLALPTAVFAKVRLVGETDAVTGETVTGIPMFAERPYTTEIAADPELTAATIPDGLTIATDGLDEV